MKYGDESGTTVLFVSRENVEQIGREYAGGCKFCAVGWAGGGRIGERATEVFEGEVPLKSLVQSTA